MSVNHKPGRSHIKLFLWPVFALIVHPVAVVILGQCGDEDATDDNQADKQKMAAHDSAFAVLLKILHGAAEATPGVA